MFIDNRPGASTSDDWLKDEMLFVRFFIFAHEDWNEFNEPTQVVQSPFDLLFPAKIPNLRHPFASIMDECNSIPQLDRRNSCLPSWSASQECAASSVKV
jgi:hypothetical protein